MLSSTSSSELAEKVRPAGPPPYAHLPRTALIALFCLLVLLEGVTRFGFERVSRLGIRTATDYSRAVSIRPQPKGEPPTVLMLGNSLLLAALDYETARKELAPQARVVRFVIEQTEYLDWYYGIRRLLAEGSRPELILLCLNTTHLISPKIRGEFNSNYLYQLRDIPAIAREARYDLTQTSGLFFAHFSRFYSYREGMRNFVLNRADPGYAGVVHSLAAQPPKMPSARTIASTADERMRRLKQELRPYGIKLVFIVPPGSVRSTGAVADAAARCGIDVVAPIPPGTLSRAYYSDGLHLNEKGARLFTQGLVEQLKAYLTRTEPSRGPAVPGNALLQ